MRTSCLAAVALLLMVASAQAVTIGYSATDVPDVVPGEDLWRYDYTVGGGTFLQSQFFDIYFNPVLYGHLTAGPSPNSGWDVAILQQPNPANLPPFDRGMFDAFALTNNPSVASVFSVSFVYLGAGRPGSQPFDVFGADATLLSSGVTSPIRADVPEPSTFTLLTAAASLLGIGFVRKGVRRR